MEKKLKSLRIQHLHATDQITATLRDLQIDRLEFCLYDYVLSGEIEIDNEGINATGLFSRAYENMTRHLTTLEEAFADAQRIYRELVDALWASHPNE